MDELPKAILAVISDYENNPQPYCGDTITNNPYYDDDVNDE